MDPQYGQQQNPGNQPGYYPPPVRPEQPAGGGGNPQVSADLIKRGIALFVDNVIAFVVCMVVSIPFAIVLGGLGVLVGGAAGAAVMLARDVLLQGQSPGKKIMGIAAVTNSGAPLSLIDSAKRNSTLSLGLVSYAARGIPFVGWALGGLLGLAAFCVGVYELYLVATNQTRLGDNLAQTHVVAQGQAVIAL
jgi:uncharacterized RDD family membrane protein YckC